MDFSLKILYFPRIFVILQGERADSLNNLIKTTSNMFSYLQKRWITASTIKRLMISMCVLMVLIVVYNIMLSDYFDSLSDSDLDWGMWLCFLILLLALPFWLYYAYCLVTQVVWPTDYQKGVNYYYGQKGDYFTSKQDYEKAVECFRRAVEKGDARAQFYLGLCYEEGQGVPQDYREAVRWYRRGAEQGNAKAQWQLGCCYERGYGVPKDIDEALKWYRKAAEKGDAKYQYSLGAIYEADDNGFPQDYEEAVKWYREAAGHVKWNYGLPVDEKWYRKVAKYFEWSHGNVHIELANAAPAIYALGRCYEEGRGVPQDKEEAVKLYRKAARLGNDEAREKLKELWFNPKNR